MSTIQFKIKWNNQSEKIFTDTCRVIPHLWKSWSGYNIHVITVYSAKIKADKPCLITQRDHKAIIYMYGKGLCTCKIYCDPTWKRPTSIESATATSNFFSSNNSCSLGKLSFDSCLYIDIRRASPAEPPAGWLVGLSAEEVGEIEVSTSLSTTWPTIRQTTAKVPVKRVFY